MTQASSADIGVTGLAVMGRNLARNLARHGHVVALHNRSPERTRSLVAEHGSEGTFVPSESMKEFVASLSQPRAIIIMVKAGQPTDAVIDELVPLLDEGDIVIDCGNAHFMDTRRREAALREHGLHFVGCGVSGGEEGALLGPSIMPGGSKESYAKLGPDLRVDRGPGGRHAVLHARRPGRGRALRQDGAQRHRVRRHAAHRRGLRPAPGRPGRPGPADRRDLPHLERRRPGLVPDPDHRRGAGAHRCGDRQAVRGHRARPGRAEGHRPVDGAERAGPRHPDHRHRRGHVRPVAVRARRPARRGPGHVRHRHRAAGHR